MSRGGRHEATEGARTPGGRLLVVGPGAGDSAAFCARLEAEGHCIERVDDEDGAAAALGRGGFDLVVLDLPPGGGDAAAWVARARPASARRAPPLLLLSDSAEGAARSLALGVDACVLRPPDPDLMSDRVRTLLALGRAAEALGASDARLAALRRRQLEFGEAAARDLRAPLGAVVSGLRSLRQRLGPSDDPELARALDDVESAAERLQGAADDLSLVGRLEGGAVALRPRPASLGPLLAEALSAVRRGRAGDATVALNVDGESDIAINVDADLLRRVVGNALDNFLRHTPPGGTPRVGARLDGDEAVITLSNGAPGAAQAPHPVEERKAHAGLSLYVCEAAVRALGGRLDIVEGAGEWPDVLTIRLPAPRTPR